MSPRRHNNPLEAPIANDGVQTLGITVEGWASPYYKVDTTAAALKEHMQEAIGYWTRYTDNIEFTYYGYDPRVLDDDGAEIGTYGYPDFVGKYDPKTETVKWEMS